MESYIYLEIYDSRFHRKGIQHFADEIPNRNYNSTEGLPAVGGAKRSCGRDRVHYVSLLYLVTAMS